MSDHRDDTKQLGAWFLGPKAENAEWEQKMVSYILEDYYHWRRNYFPSDEILVTQALRREATEWNDRLFQQIMEMLAGLRRHFPFYSPRYIAHMLSDQTIPSRLGYFAGLLYNPNNVTPEGAPVTVKWELEVGAEILRMLGYEAPDGDPKREFGWAHVTGGGTVANLEALWMARNVRYFPLAVRDAAIRYGIAIAARPFDDLRAVSPEQVLTLRPNQEIYLFPRFVEAVRRHYAIDRAAAAHRVFEMLRESEASVMHHGTRVAYGTRPPALFVAGSRHYSIDKAADILGLGKENVFLVETDSMFRMDVRDLESKLHAAIARGFLPLAVIAIAGTTEESAVDPVHKIAELQEAREDVSFWLHVDAAWGGYFRSILPSHPGTVDEVTQDLNQFVARDLTLRRGRYEKHVRLQWGFPDLTAALLAFPRADSITVDPHKMGYVPYPCGVAAFKNDLVRQFAAEEAPYLSETTEEDIAATRRHEPPTSVGPYILEGSKSGAAVAACWLSHRMIPPRREGYGEIVRASLLAARELYERLVHWDVAAKTNGEDLPYRFVVITERPPDTNIVCFVVADKSPAPLERTNRLNRALFEQFTIDAEHGASQYSYLQPFFLSRTSFRAPGYSARSVADLLERLGAAPADYEANGLFVLRATLMSPYLTLAAETGHKQELLAEFVEELARRTDQVLEAWGI